jgi:hypothetical protein
VASLPAAVWSGLLRAVGPLVVLAHRWHSVGIVRFGVAVRAGAGGVGHLGERVLEVAQPLVREIEGFHIRALLPQSPQRRQVDRLPGTGLLAAPHGMKQNMSMSLLTHTASPVVAYIKPGVTPRS